LPAHIIRSQEYTAQPNQGYDYNYSFHRAYFPEANMNVVILTAGRLSNVCITCKGGPQSGQGARVATASRVTGDLVRFMQLLDNVPPCEIRSSTTYKKRDCCHD
jgi:hypothetical protein